jgi:hypothetical protein
VQRIFNPERDWRYYIRNYKTFNNSLKGFANSEDAHYLIVFSNFIKICFYTGEFHAPYNYFEAIGIPDIKLHIDRLISRYPGKIELTDYSPGNHCRILTTTDQNWITDMYYKMMESKSELSKDQTKYYRSLHNKISTEQSIKYSDSPIIKYVEYLNSVNLPECILNNCEAAKSIFKDPYSLISIQDTIENIISKKPITFNPHETINYRIGGLFSNLLKEVRRFILKDCVEFDIKSAHLSFLCAKTGLELPDNIYDLISAETGLKKELVKLCIVRTIYGGTQSPRDALITDPDRRARQDRKRANHCPEVTQDQERDDYQTIKSNLWFSQILNAVEKFSKEIIDNNGVMDAFGKFIPYTFIFDDLIEVKTDIKTIMAAYYSSIEKRLIMKLLPLTNKGMRIISDEHDGVSCYFSNPDRKEEMIKLCKSAVEKEAKKMGIKTTLEIKS